MIDRQKVLQYLNDMQRQLEVLQRMPVPNADFFLQRDHFERTKAIKYSLLVPTEDVIHVSMHVAVALGLGKPKDAASAILQLAQANIISSRPNSKQSACMTVWAE